MLCGAYRVMPISQSARTNISTSQVRCGAHAHALAHYANASPSSKLFAAHLYKYSYIYTFVCVAMLY